MDNLSVQMFGNTYTTLETSPQTDVTQDPDTIVIYWIGSKVDCSEGIHNSQLSSILFLCERDSEMSSVISHTPRTESKYVVV